MSSVDVQPSRSGRWILSAAIAVILLLAGIGWYLRSASGKESASQPAGPADATTTQVGTRATTSEPVTTTTTAAVSRPATRPVITPWSPPRFEARQRERDAMVRTIRYYGLKNKSVLKAMAAVPRHEFVPKSRRNQAYADRPLPIGYGQTISQPYMVAEMSRQLKLKPDSRVLEIGTGSGYQAAVLSEFTRQVYTIEIVKPLAEKAQTRLKRLGYRVVRVREGDGYYGWAEKEPFDAIIVTAAAPQIPPPLLKQLARGGRMVIPIGGPYSRQSLVLVTKAKDGSVRTRSLMPVAFVPFLSKAWGK